MIEIVPAIDVLDGKCVRLSKGDYNQKKVYNEDPLEVALAFEDHGIKRLHLVDLDGAKAHKIINYKVLERVATRTSLVIDFGGGLKSDDDLKIAFSSGAQMITGGSIAVKKPDVFESWLRQYGASRIILGADCRDRKIAVSGWLEETDDDILSFIERWREKGIQKLVCTDIEKDGMLSGTSIDLYKEILDIDPDLYLIASGGVSNIKDIEALDEAGIPSVIVGKAIYEGRIKWNELTKYIC